MESKMLDYGYKTRADNIWSHVSTINHEIKKATGSPMYNCMEDIKTIKAAIFLFHFMFLDTDVNNEGCGVSKEESDVFLKNICRNGLFKKGKFYLSDWEHPEHGWMNFVLDILVVKGEIFRTESTS